MKFLLDTNVLSELIKSEPDPNVLEWFNQVMEEHLFISVLTLGEIEMGIEKLAPGRKKNDLKIWFDRLTTTFQYQSLAVDSAVAMKWGYLTAFCRKNGKSLPAIDGLIASTAYVHGAILVSRNTKDFNGIPIQLLNPWL